jgi:predicted ATPase
MLLSRLAEVDIKTAFNEQRGNPIELFTQYGDDWYADEMEFTVEMLINRKVKDNWGGEVELNNTRLRYKLILNRKNNNLGFEDLYVKLESLEKIRPDEDNWIKKFNEAKPLAKTLRAGGSRDPYINTGLEGTNVAIKMRQDGKQGGKATPADTISQTVLGGVNTVDFPHVFAAKEEMHSWRLLQLNPEYLREPTKQEPGIKDTITSSGKNLASSLYRIKQIDEYNLVEISRKLNVFLPEFIEVNVYDDKANRQYIIKLKGEDGKEFTSRVLSEGTLRILALCILEYDDKHTGLLCFEEPENGIHPYRIKAMTMLLKALSTDFLDTELPLRQAIVNTHSPVVVNEMLPWSSDKNVSVHFSEMRTRIIEIKNKKIKINVSKISPALKNIEFQTILEFSEQDRKLTFTAIKDYLTTSNFENTLRNIESL